MPTLLTTPAVKLNTYIVKVVFRDEEDELVVPNSGLTWTLTDSRGNVINSRSAVAITSASTINIVLSGVDLDVFSDDLRRRVIVTGTYNSTLGNNLAIRDVAEFDIQSEDKQ